MSRPDLFELLAGADPARSHPGLDPSSARGQALLARAIAAEPVLVARERQARWRRVVLAVAVAIASLGVAAAAWVHSRQATETLNVGCYTEARLDANVLVVRSIDACRQLWQDGTITRREPPLAACVLDSGLVGVFPGDAATCARLNLPVLAGRATSVPELGERLAQATARCVSEDEARAAAQQAMADLGLRDWRVVTRRPFGPGDCATIAIEEPAKTIGLVPRPRR